MAQRADFSMKWLFLALTAIALTSCATKPADHAKADEAAVRGLLADVEQRINKDDIGFVNAFAQDAVIIAPSSPDVTGLDAIRTMYAGLMKQDSMAVHFSTEEVTVMGDFAYEHGTYTLRISDK